MNYTTEQLRQLMETRSKELADNLEDVYTTDRDSFLYEVGSFIEWLEKEEKPCECSHYFPGAYTDTAGYHYKPCEFCGIVKK